MKEQNGGGCTGMTICSPLTGTAVSVDQVPDPVFSQKILGDGAAIEPTSGKIVSPVNGTVVSVAETLHAYGFESEDGVEVLVHFGLETVGLKGECFQSYVKPGDKVKAGDLVAEADLEALKAKGINPITPVLLCGGMDDRTMNLHMGPVEAGKTELMTILDNCDVKTEEKTAPAGSGEVQKADSQAAPKKSGKKFPIDFDFLQKLGKVLMTVIAVMPAAGLMISVGKLVQMAGADLGVVMTIGSTMETIGWAVINNLHILFAVAIGGSWAKERAGGAFAAVIAFILINMITGSVFGVTAEMLETDRRR